MLQDIWLNMQNAWQLVSSVIGNFFTAIKFLFQAPTFTAGMSAFLPTFISVSLIHVVVIAVLKAIFGR